MHPKSPHLCFSVRRVAFTAAYQRITQGGILKMQNFCRASVWHSKTAGRCTPAGDVGQEAKGGARLLFSSKFKVYKNRTAKMAMASLYRRILPAPPAVDFPSSEGKVKAKGISFGKLACLTHYAGAKVEAFCTNQNNVNDFWEYARLVPLQMIVM